MPRLDRFKRAQDDLHAGFESALEEIRAGRKRGHWIWYVFPQLDGLGMSSMARAYGIDGETEAVAYLRDPQLRERLLTITRAAAEQLSAGRPASSSGDVGGGTLRLSTLMGSEIDAKKLVSSLTLFAEVARRLAATAAADGEDADAANEYGSLAATAAEILTIASAQGYPRCAFTRRVLGMAD
jgi:uncharacterized protein (DUF1810 family)